MFDYSKNRYRQTTCHNINETKMGNGRVNLRKKKKYDTRRYKKGISDLLAIQLFNLLFFIHLYVWTEHLWECLIFKLFMLYFRFSCYEPIVQLFGQLFSMFIHTKKRGGRNWGGITIGILGNRSYVNVGFICFAWKKESAYRISQYRIMWFRNLVVCCWACYFKWIFDEYYVNEYDTGGA